MEKFFNIFVGCNNMKPVSIMDDKITIRDDHFRSTSYSTYQNFDLELAVKLSKRYSAQMASFFDNEFYHFDFSLHKSLYLCSIRKKDRSGNLKCSRKFRVDSHTQS